jgi:hypothetical protein
MTVVTINNVAIGVHVIMENVKPNKSAWTNVIRRTKQRIIYVKSQHLYLPIFIIILKK